MAPRSPNTRSGFGDNHAATEDAMMAAHADHMLKAGLVDEQMAEELSKPRRNQKEIEINYTPEYLATFPTYTGENHDDMPSLEDALKRQAERDKAQSKLLADYFAGKVDMDGNPIAGAVDAKSPKKSAAKEPATKKRKSPTGTTDYQENTMSADNDSPEQPTAKRHRTIKPAKSKGDSANTHGSSIVTELKVTIAATIKIASPESPAIKRSSKTPSPKAPFPISSSSASSHSSTSSAKTKSIITPLSPLPGQPDYAEINYYHLAAMCRERSLRGCGKEQEVRNRLIQDDINVIQGQPRETTKIPQKKRQYKHVAPKNVDAGLNRGKSGPEGTVDSEQ